jgi:uncharacterized membrane protein
MIEGQRTVRPVRAAGIALGIGMGGFVDGILFHQIFQFHNMLSAKIPTDEIVGAKVNMVWDGVFHSFVWIVTAIGLVILYRAAKRADVRFSDTTFIGSLLMGWGLFNFVEGVIDHHILQLHHVYERAGLSIWDYGFLAWGAVMILAGWMMLRNDRIGSL